MAIYQLKENQKECLRELFAKLDDSLIISCIQNYFGDAWVDDAASPKSGQIICGDFCFLAGVPNRELVENLPEKYYDGFMIMIPDDAAWYPLIREAYGDACKQSERYALEKEGDIFDRELLRSYIKCILPEYTVKLFEEKEYHLAMANEWSRDFCSNFRDYAHYQECGLGVAVWHGDEMVAGASSYTSYREGMEIEIVTREDYRRRGLALASGAAIILAALERGLYPNWDAQNMMSVGTAQKLGYHYKGPYTIFEVTA